jgi:hypothetical protein
MKDILVINYSQSGQLDQILDHFLEPLSGFNIERVKVETKTPFPFPWNGDYFFEIMPETVLEEPIELAEFELKKEKYDLIIVGYQPWFLSPSMPTTALFHTEKFKAVLKNTPVATVIGSRNMWLNSQKSIVKWIEAAGGTIVANVPFIDKVQNHISALTILHWMLSGEKTKRWGILPLPGVDQRDIAEAGKYGTPFVDAIQNNNYKGLQTKILNKGGIDISYSILFIEMKAKRIFYIWANVIKKKGTNPKKKALWCKIFNWYLTIALFVVSPILLILFYTIILPLTFNSKKRLKESFLYLNIEK